MNEKIKDFWHKWWPLLPGTAAAAGVGISLALTQPVLAEVPELLSPSVNSAPAAEATVLTAAAGDLPYKDGVYEGTAAGYGGDITVRVTLQNGTMTAIDVISADDEDESFFLKARTIIPTMLEQNTWEVDTVSGATYSSKGLKNAVENALTGKTQSKKSNVKGGSLPYADGIYEGTAPGYGGDITVKVTMESGAIIAVDLVNADEETPSFLKKARTVLTDIVENNTWEVDTVSGATFSSRGILNAVKNALTGVAASANVKQGALELADGVYEGTGTGYGGEIKVRVTVESGAISSVDIAAAEDETLSYFTKARKVIDDVVENNTWQVDTITGATYSSRGILEAVENALTGATSKKTVKDQGSLDYDDGQYVGTATGYGGDIKVRVTMEDGYIVGVDILEAEDETDSYFNKARKVLDDVYTANTWDVDTVTGATYSSKGILNAIKNALKGTTPTPAPTVSPSGKTYKDGVYYGEAEGYEGMLKLRVTVDDGKILAIDIVSAEDIETVEDKEDNLPYFIKGRAIIDTILAAQTAEVDTVSRATYTSGGIKTAVAQALAQAEVAEPTATPAPETSPEPTASPEPTESPDPTTSPEPTESPEPTVSPEPTQSPEPTETPAGYADGSYSGTAVCTDEGAKGGFDYDLNVSFTVTDGVIGAITVEKGEDRSEKYETDPESNDTYLNRAINGKTGYTGIPEQIAARQSADSIDVVSRATYSSKAIQAAVQNALAAGPQ